MSKELAIATYGLTKRFEGHIAVNDLDLQIKNGEVYGLIGPNGAGKTTLIKMLAMAEEPTKGEIYLNGDRLRDDSNFLLKKRIGYLPDNFPLYDDLTVWDYLDYYARLYGLKPSQRHHRLFEVLELVQLENKRKSIISTLSRGMKQRLGLARTIVHEPILLLLDEPILGLDPLARQQFRQIIKILQEAGMTILISSHVLSDLAELCTSIGIMELGFLVESAPKSELYQRLSRQQIIIGTLGKMEVLQQKLSQNSLVKTWEMTSNNCLKVDFVGGEADCAELLRSLILADIPVTQFDCRSEDLETIFLNLRHQQTS